MVSKLDKSLNPTMALMSTIKQKEKQKCDEATLENQKNLEHVSTLIDHYAAKKGTFNAADLRRLSETTSNLNKSKIQLQQRQAELEHASHIAEEKLKSWKSREKSVEKYSEKLAQQGLFKEASQLDQTVTDMMNAKAVQQQNEDNEPSSSNPFKGSSPAA